MANKKQAPRKGKATNKKQTSTAKKKMLTTSRSRTKKVEEFSDLNKTVLCCVFCDSPSVRTSLLNGKEHYYCLRCGKHHICVQEKPLSECKDLLAARQSHTKLRHEAAKKAREKKFYLFLDNFYLRMSFRLISLLLIIGGFVFAFSNFWTGLLFIVVGLVSLWTAESL